MSAPITSTLIFTSALLSPFICMISGFGSISHGIISYRASVYFGAEETQKIVQENPDGLFGGSVFPDVFYDAQCSEGNYSFVSDATKSTAFLNTSINYILRKYPKPWNNVTEKLVSFLFGVMSHQVADYMWYGEDKSQQGFLNMMARLNFHGNFQETAVFAELGSDAVLAYDLNLDHIKPFLEWFVPVSDLVNIYALMFGEGKVPYRVVENCTVTRLIYLMKEKIKVSEFYAAVAPNSPFLMTQLLDYFPGGVDDSAGWVIRKWNVLNFMLQNGLSHCVIPSNPLQIQCNTSTTLQHSSFTLRNSGIAPKSQVFKQVSGPVHFTDVHKNQEESGVRFFPSKTYWKKMEKEHHHYQNQRHRTKDLNSIGNYFVNNTFAKLGWALASGDVDLDEYKDLLIGAPGYSLKNSPQTGKVFLLFATVQVWVQFSCDGYKSEWREIERERG